MPRLAPRWAKWSRGVRTRGLRVGLVGGPRPLYFLAPGFSRVDARFRQEYRITILDFPKKWHNIRHDEELELIRRRINEASGHLVGGRFATVAASARTLWHF